MKLNTLPMLTWRWVKVNDTNLELPNFVHEARNALPKEDSTSLPAESEKHWTMSPYGVSKESVALSQHGNAKNLVHVREDEVCHEQYIYQPNLSQPVLLDHHVLTAEKNSTLHMVLDYRTAENSEHSPESFRNSVLKVLAKEGSRVNIYYISRSDDKNLALFSLVADIHKDANVHLIQVEIGSKKSFFHYTANLLEEGSGAEIDSIYFTNQDRELEIFYHINHIGKETKSRISVNGALKDRAKKTFKGTIDFKRGSSKSKGSEEEYATLLDDSVRNIAVPILLCREDDVEGVHAASAGKIDEDLLFYIMSRGLSLSQAKKIIVEAKLTPTLDLISDETLKNQIWERIEQAI